MCERELSVTETKEIDKEVEAIKRELKAMKERECKRLLREFKVNHYSIRYNITLAKALSAILGYEYMKRELDKGRHSST